MCLNLLIHHLLSLIYGLHEGPYLAGVACCTYLCFGQPLRCYRFVLLLGLGFLDTVVLGLGYPNVDWLCSYSHFLYISVIFKKISKGVIS